MLVSEPSRPLLEEVITTLNGTGHCLDSNPIKLFQSAIPLDHSEGYFTAHAPFSVS